MHLKSSLPLFYVEEKDFANIFWKDVQGQTKAKKAKLYFKITKLEPKKSQYYKGFEKTCFVCCIHNDPHSKNNTPRSCIPTYLKVQNAKPNKKQSTRTMVAIYSNFWVGYSRAVEGEGTGEPGLTL